MKGKFTCFLDYHKDDIISGITAKGYRTFSVQYPRYIIVFMRFDNLKGKSAVIL